MDEQKNERQVNNRYNKNYNKNQPHGQSQARRGAQASKQNGGNMREGISNKGFYRDRNRNKSTGSGRYANNRGRAEETIDDIKKDIVRIEKEIELEIKEIKSLKL